MFFLVWCNFSRIFLSKVEMLQKGFLNSVKSFFYSGERFPLQWGKVSFTGYKGFLYSVDRS